MRSSRLACTLLAARRAMSTKRVGVLVKDGHAAWPPRLNDCDATLINAPTADELQAKASSIDALVWVPGVAAAEVTRAFETLKPQWVHSFPAGVDGLSGFLASDALQARQVPVTNGKGAFSSSLAEYVIAAIMHFTKQIPRCLTNQKEKKWDPFVMDVVAGKTVGFVGYGHIAQQTAVLCKALGMRIIACRRSSGGEDVVAPSQTYAPADRLKLFAEADYVVCSLPGTAATQDFCGAQEFGAMKSTGVFVSLGRGAAVDEVTAAFYAKTAAAEAARDAETKACVRLQSAWRGRTTRVLLAFWSLNGLNIERVTRGHLGRQTARRAMIDRDLRRQCAFFGWPADARGLVRVTGGSAP